MENILAKPIPCKDCITLAICRSYCGQEIPYSKILVMRCKCSLIDEYLNDTEVYNRIYLKSTFRIFMKGIELDDDPM